MNYKKDKGHKSRFFPPIIIMKRHHHPIELLLGFYWPILVATAKYLSLFSADGNLAIACWHQMVDNN